MAEKKRKKDGRMQYGKDIESLQDKVDSYMDPKLPDGPSVSGPNQTAPEPTDTKSAPLLPSDKIPKSVSADPKEQKPAEKPKKTDNQPEADTQTAQDSSYDDWPDPAQERKENLDLENSATSKAVDEIVASESDKLLETQDQAVAEQQDQTEQEPPKEDKGSPKKPFYKRKKFYKWLFIVTFFAALIAMAVPTSRYFILNALGVRASTYMRVIDKKTGQPLKNVDVSLEEQTAVTGVDGEARLYDIKLGRHDMTIAKPAFAGLSQEVTIGWGSNPLGDMELKPVGAQYKIMVRDYLSGLPVSKVEASSGQADALSNDKGEIVLVIEDTDKEELEVTLKADGYRQEKIEVTPEKQDVGEIVMVPSRKHAFVSKRTGSYDLFKTDIDGKNEKLVLAGTGSESSEELILVNHPTDEVAAYVSTRGDVRSNSGEMLATLQIVDLNTDEIKEVVSASRIQVVDWVGEKLVYIKEQPDKKPNDPSLHKLMSYDYKSGTEVELAAANYFNDVSVAKGVVYFSPAGSGKQTGFYTINVDGTNKRSITDKEVWNIFRTAYYNLRVSLGQQWYDYNLDDGSFNKADGPPSVLKSRVYYDSPDRTRSIWSEDRDGKGSLILYDHSENQDETILAKGGLKNPLRWLNDSVVIFRIDDGQETADYAMSLDGGEAKKITDVTDVTGIDRWYFY